MMLILSYFLTASPPVDYEGMEDERYVIIPSSSTPVETELMCAFERGALPSKYTFEWRRLPPNAQVFNDDTRMLSVNVSAGDAAKYRCSVTIVHMTKGNTQEDATYDGPEITVYTKGEFSVYWHTHLLFVSLLLLLLTNGLVILTVLSTLADDNITNISVTIGEPATFSCNFERRDTDFNIIWKVGELEYPCNNLPMDSEFKCNKSGNAGVLQIADTTVVGAGTYIVQCILQPTIDQKYKIDPSFQPQFSENIIRTATLEVVGITSTMGELFQPCVSYFHSLS